MRQSLFLGVLVCAALLAAGCTPSESPGVASSDSGRVRLGANASYAELSDYVVHVNAMVTADLTPEIAANYGIRRSEEKGLVNLVVLRKTDAPGMDAPVQASIQVLARNLTEQTKDMALREIVDGPSIYYIGEVPVENREIINFDFDIRPADSDRALLVRFTHEFYTR